MWSCEYLLKTIITGGSVKPSTWAVVWQVRRLLTGPAHPCTQSLCSCVVPVLLLCLVVQCLYSLPGIIHTAAHVQVGNETVDKLSWTRPEDITTPRSFYYNKLALNGASDLNGQIVGALASTAAVFKTKQPSLYDKYMNVALPLYGMAIGAHIFGGHHACCAAL